MLARAATRPLERLLPAAAAAASGAACTPPMAAATSPAAWLTCQRPYAHDASSAGSNAPEGGAQQGGSSPAAAAAAHGGGSSASSGTAAPGGSGSFAASAYGEHSMHDHYDYQQQHGYELSEEEEEEAARRRHARAAADPAFRHQRERLMDAALRHVPTLGWAGGAAAAAAAAELGLSPAAAGMLGSDAELVQAFVQRCNQRLEAELRELSAAGKMQGLDTRERLRLGLVLRLRMVEPHLPNWAQALALLAQPQAAPRSVQLYADLADALWHAAGDVATDLSWYTKRALLAGVYSASELYMLTDSSPGLADTWDQVGRRLGEALQLARAADEGASLAGAAGGAAGDALSQLLGLLTGRGRGPVPPPV